jgi:drug/metabolite transporter (DMT)-like permease
MPALLMIIATLFWGASFLFIKLALVEISPISFLFWRFLVATISMLPILLFSPITFDKEGVKQGIKLGIIQIGIMFLQTIGLETISASLSGFLTGFYIVFVLIIRFIIQKRMPSTMDVISSLICLGGLGLLTHSFKVTSGLGVLYTLGGAFCMALYIYALDAYSKANNSILLTFIQMVSLAAFPGILVLLPGNSLQIPTKLITWVSIIFCGICCSSVAFWLQNKAQKQLGAFKVSIILMLEPVFCTILAYFVLGEKLYTASYIGIAMILGSIAVINTRLKEV